MKGWLAEARGPAGRATLGLGVTQIIGWGSTFMMPSVLGQPISGSSAPPIGQKMVVAKPPRMASSAIA